MKTTINTLLFCLLTATIFTDAIAFEYQQHIKLNTSYTNYSDPTQISDDSNTLNNLNYRINLSENFSDYKIESHYQLSTVHSNNQNLTYINPDERRLFNLSSLISDDNQSITQHRLDRLLLSFNTDNTRTKFGRQTISWGNGLVYNVLDIFNPFSPTAIDKEYKSGDDMLYTQLLINNNSDWQLLYLPRRNAELNIKQSESSYAAKYHTTTLTSDIDLLFAKHYESDIIGIGFSQPIGNTIWRIDITHTETDDNMTSTSLISNIDYSWSSFNTNIYGFIELYHNGFGNKDIINPINFNLSDRISRGEIFSYFKNYITTGIRIELHPLVTLSPTIIQEMDNNTSSLVFNLSYEWTQRLNFRSNLLYNRSTDLIPTNNSIDFLLSYYF